MRSPTRLPYVEAIPSRGKLFLYYRRDGRRQPLPGPEGSAAFLSEYDRLHAEFENPNAGFAKHTVGAAIEDYLASADFRTLSDETRRLYRSYLSQMQERIGHVLVTDIDVNWVDRLRDRLALAPHRWNAIRSRMKEVFGRYRRRHPQIMPINPWDEVKRIEPPRSTQNRRWPDEVLTQVLRAATPEFRALVTTLLLTGQRVGDVVAFRPEQYDQASRTLGYTDTLAQEKTDKRKVLHVPDALAEVFDAMKGRLPDRLLVTPRGRAWTVLNAEETLLSLRARLELPRYTLHGLRKTGLSAAKMLGFENRRLRALSGHDSDRNLEIYLDGVDEYALAKEVQSALETHFAGVLTKSKEGANSRRFSGMTGRAAANAGVKGQARRRSGENKAGLASAKQLLNAKQSANRAEKT